MNFNQRGGEVFDDFIHISPNDITLTDVTRHPDGTVASGWVASSGWFFKRGDGVQQAFVSKDSRSPVHTWPDHPISESGACL